MRLINTFKTRNYFSCLSRRCLFFALLSAWALGCGYSTDGGHDKTKLVDPADTADTGDGTDDDTEDESDEEPACLSDIDPTLAGADAQALFDYDHVPSFDLYLPEAEWEALQKNARDEQYTEAEACFEGHGIGTVGLRFKGSYGTLYGCFDSQDNMTCKRLSMKLKFDKYVEDQRFFGLKRLIFNANRYDDSRMKERLAYDLYRSMGIVAPRASWAVVRVNGKSYGLYGMVEPVDGRFTANRWPDNPDANLYKEAWPGDTGSALVSALRTNEEEAEVSGYTAFSDAMAEADEDDLSSTLGKYTDLDYWARCMAVDDAILSYDGITYFFTDGVHTHNHNYFFYEDSPEHFTLIPWDVETTFWINEDHKTPHWTVLPEDCGTTYEYWGGRATAPACNMVFRALNTDRSAWRAAIRELLDGPFALDTMLETIDRHAEFIGDEARSDATPTEYGTFDGSVSGIKSVIPDLRAHLEELIAEEE
jgi:spore coat protein H